jgi:putative transposase
MTGGKKMQVQFGHPRTLEQICVETPVHLTRDEMEARRQLAAQDFKKGASQADVAERFGVSRTTAGRWNLALVTGGMQALKRKKSSGRPRRLTPGQEQRLVEMHNNAVVAAGTQGTVWTAQALSDIILDRFGIRYHCDHVPRIMHRLGLPLKYARTKTKGKLI